MRNWGDMGNGNGMMGFGWILGTLLLIGVISLIVFAAMGMIPRARPGPTPGPTTPGALPPEGGQTRSAAESELELRFARGEIDAVALVEARSVLRQQ